MTLLEKQQKYVCDKFQVHYQPCDLNLKVGISRDVKTGQMPINGLRVKEEKGTSGWYIWAGNWSNDPNFFVPIHGIHLNKWAKIIIPYLGLPEGWRFLITEDYEDVWEDPQLLAN